MGDRLRDKIVAITGTGGGQGRAAAVLFAEEGATVIGGDVKVEGSEETVEMVRANGGTMTSTHPLDFTDPDAVGKWIDSIVADHGRLDILYNNASGPRFAPFAEMPVEDWHWTVRHELDLPYYVTRAAWPHLVANGGGAIVIIASIQGMIANRPTVGGFAHAATKGGLIGITRELANEGGPHGIRVNSVSPGLIQSHGTQPYLDAQPEYGEAFLDRQIIKRLGQPEDIARAALFLVSEEASFITGQNLVVDGGYTAV